MVSGSTFAGSAIPISIEGIRTEIQQVFGQWPTITQILVELDAPVIPNLAAGPNEQTVYLNHVFSIIEDRFTIQVTYIATQTNKIEEFKAETIQVTYIATQTNKIEEFKAENVELLRTLAGKQAQLDTGGAATNQKPTTSCQTQKDLSIFKSERSNILVQQEDYQSWKLDLQLYWIIDSQLFAFE
ncbi:hypothetical protein OCU04_001042 [Sclerotinia nivalis]|uniref:Uncharacterized protein n=1 Tax=Sclerotinia nivalis TaxID=352851 RepID=A0A9X0AXB8_9HELO|nr:hypothetical protein OCU04_001042 [Sclerotinia nivalis]